MLKHAWLNQTNLKSDKNDTINILLDEIKTVDTKVLTKNAKRVST